MHFTNSSQAFIDRLTVCFRLAQPGSGDFQGGLQGADGGAQFVGDVGGEGFFAVEGSGEAGEQFVEASDDGEEFGGGRAGIETFVEVIAADAGDLFGNVVDGAKLERDQPPQGDGGGEGGTGGDEQELLGESEEIVADMFDVRGDEDGGGESETIGGRRAFLIGAADERKSDHAGFPAIGETDVGARRRAGVGIIGDDRGGKVVVAEGGGAEEGRAVWAEDFEEVSALVGGVSGGDGGIGLEVKGFAFLFDEGGERGGAGDEGFVELAVEGVAHGEVVDDAGEDEGGETGDGGGGDEAGAQGRGVGRGGRMRKEGKERGHGE